MKLLSVLFLLTMLLAACDGDDEAGPTSTPAPSVTATDTAPPTSTATPAPSATADPGDGHNELKDMSLEMKVGQILATGIQGTSAGPDAQHLIQELHIGNIVLMGHNAGTPDQVAQLTAQIQQLALAGNGIGAIIATDQEGGTVQRLTDGFTLLPDARTAGEAGSADLARQYGAMIASELRAVGVNMDLAPVLDVNDNPANPVIGRRAFGTTPDVVTETGTAFIDGMQGANVIAVGKHFPGHGNTETDSHFTLPVVKKSLEELQQVELAPFKAAIADGLSAIMVAHVSYTALEPSGMPASLSQAVTTGLLRDELGFEGISVTDDMGMAGAVGLMAPERAVVEAVKAGADLVLCVSLPCEVETARAALIDAVNSGEIPMARIDEAVRRILAVKETYDVAAGAQGDIATVGSAEHQQLVSEIEAGGG